MQIRSLSRLFIAFLLGIVCVPNSGYCDLIHVDFSGEVVATVGSFGDVFDVGDPVSGRYTFDSTTSDRNMDPVIGAYGNALTAWTIHVGATVFTLNTGGVQKFIFVVDSPDERISAVGPGEDLYQIFAELNPVLDAPQVSTNWFFLDTSGTAFGNDALPIILPDISLFDDNLVQIFDSRVGVRSAVFLEIDSLVIPEPNSLIICGVLGIGYWHQRKMISG